MHYRIYVVIDSEEFFVFRLGFDDKNDNIW